MCRGNPFWVFLVEKALAGERIALISPTLVAQCFSVLPGFGPAAELAPWRVPKGATVVVEAKVAQTIDAPFGLIT